MGTGYTRNDTANNIADGNVINASDLDGEFDAVQAAFNGTTGHSHDGTSGEGPQIDTAGLADNAVTTAKITDANVTLAKMAANSVDSDQYVDGSIDRVHLAADIVDGTKLADNAVNSEHYTDGSIDRVHLAADIVDGTKIADDSIDSEHYVDGSIDTAHIANDAVTGDKLANNIQIAGTLGVTGETTLTTHLNMGDNDIIKLGDSADLQIYHNGTDSIISDTGAGNLALLTNGTLVGMYTSQGETMFTASKDGGVNLWYDNSAKIVTTATGVSVTGSIGLTGTVDGRDVASDGSKLDGIESGATADQSASEILTLIKTVDGSGSGLDADTLDGVSSGSFLRSDAEDTKTAGALNFNDNILARFGTGNDLQIYHDGSNSYIIDQGTGQLRIRASNLQLQDSSGHIYIEGVDTGTGGTVTLYHNAVAKLATKSDGVDITGELQSDSLDVDGVANISGELTLGTHLNMGDNDIIKLGAGSDLQIYHDASNSYIAENGTGSLYIRGTNLILQDSSGNEYLTCVDSGTGGEVRLKHEASTKLATTSTGVSVTGNITVSGTVDGRDVASDGSKLDGIASGAQTGTVTSVATGGGLTGGTITGSGTISHADTSTQASVNNSGSNFIQDITLDDYGHVTAITSAAAGGATTGTYTPTVTFSVNNSGYPSMNVFGQYVKIDEMVFLQVEFDYLRWNATGTQTVSLPFTSKAATALNGALVVGYMDIGTNNGDSYNWVIRENATTMSGPALENGGSQQVRGTFNVMYRANS